LDPSEASTVTVGVSDQSTIEEVGNSDITGGIHMGIGPLSKYTINQLSRNLKIYTNYRQNL